MPMTKAPIAIGSTTPARNHLRLRTEEDASSRPDTPSLCHHRMATTNPERPQVGVHDPTAYTAVPPLGDSCGDLT
jgi:hypothetical protein